MKIITAIEEWANVPLATYRNAEFRRIDAVLLTTGIGVVGWYGYEYGWIGAVKGALAFTLFAFLGMFVRALFDH